MKSKILVQLHCLWWTAYSRFKSFLFIILFQNFSPEGTFPDSPLTIYLQNFKTKNAGTTSRWYSTYSFSLCSIMWLISLSSRGKWLIETKILGTQAVVYNVCRYEWECILYILSTAGQVALILYLTKIYWCNSWQQIYYSDKELCSSRTC